jgi:hypothetical protein
MGLDARPIYAIRTPHFLDDPESVRFQRPDLVAQDAVRFVDDRERDAAA